jgi:hypothetical protein
MDPCQALPVCRMIQRQREPTTASRYDESLRRGGKPNAGLQHDDEFRAMRQFCTLYLDRNPSLRRASPSLGTINLFSTIYVG